MTNPFTPPQKGLTAYNCPHCNAFAKQIWSGIIINQGGGNTSLNKFNATTCDHCHKQMFWNDDLMIYPDIVTAPLPNPDLPEDIIADYEEARMISNKSPKGAAALLRLVIQKICIHLEEDGKNLNKDIGNLVKKGLSPKIQKALDLVRVVGNDSVHPGQIDLNDDPTTVGKLFDLVNIIADSMITQPKEIDSLYDSLLSDGKKEAIEKRDGQ